MKAVKIPAEDGEELEIIETGESWQELAAVIGRGCRYIEEVFFLMSPVFNVVMIVDEDGIAHEQPRNSRASALYTGDIYGDALIMSFDHFPEPDMVEMSDPAKIVDSVKLLLKNARK